MHMDLKNKILCPCPFKDKAEFKYDCQNIS